MGMGDGQSIEKLLIVRRTAYSREVSGLVGRVRVMAGEERLSERRAMVTSRRPSF